MVQKGTKRIRKPSFIKEHCKTGVCPYSDNCFKCPAPDCMVTQGLVLGINKLPYDFEKTNVTKGRKRKTKER